MAKDELPPLRRIDVPRNPVRGYEMAKPVTVYVRIITDEEHADLAAEEATLVSFDGYARSGPPKKWSDITVEHHADGTTRVIDDSECLDRPKR